MFHLANELLTRISKIAGILNNRGSCGNLHMPGFMIKL